MSLFALVIFVGSAIWGGVAIWRLLATQQHEALVQSHLRRQIVRHVGAELQWQVEQAFAALWGADDKARNDTPTAMAKRVARALKPGQNAHKGQTTPAASWIWHAVVLSRDGAMVWPALPWEDRDDQRLLMLGTSADCATFKRSWQHLQIGHAAQLAAAQRMLRRDPACPLAGLLRKPMLLDWHLQSRYQRRWQYTASAGQAWWVVAGAGYLLLLRMHQGRYVGIALALGLSQPSMLSSGLRRRVGSVWLSPAPDTRQILRADTGTSGALPMTAASSVAEQTDWFPLSGLLSGYAIWLQSTPAAPPSRSMWLLVGVSVLVTWCALLALLLISRRRTLWEERKQALFHAITHELKTPVAAQLALLDTMARLDQVASQSSYYRALRDETERLEQLLRNVLALHHDVPPARAFQRCDITAFTHHLLEELEPLAERKEQTLSCEHRAPIWARIEPTSLALALRNLLDNAIKYTPAQGWVRVDIKSDTHELEWIVRDSGPGISEVLRQQIFTPFVRGDSREVPGSGLGLALAHKIVAQHGGRLVLLPGDQATGGFCVALPVEDES